ncbi:MAG: alpha/beta fold hydrolase [Burkholderiales bacterium]
MKSVSIRIPGSQGHELAALLDSPPEAPRAYALFAHCFTCSKDSKAAAYIARALAAHGIATLRFDFTGLGMSEGEFAETGFSSNIDDLVAAADWLRANRAAPQLLIGHSLGGAAVLAAAARVPEARAVATIAAPFEPAHVARLVEPGRAEIEARGEAEVNIGGRPFRVRQAFLDDLQSQRPAEAIRALGKALMVFHSPRDTMVDIDNAAQIFMAARHPKSFVSLDDADHLLTSQAHAAYVADVLAAWASRYLDPLPASDAPVQGVRVAETGEGRFAQLILAGRHRLRADEPVAIGGADSGPSPYELLLAALGACTSMTMRMYAAQKKWPLERVSVDLRHEKIHATDCAECETKEGRIDRIQREIRIEGALDDAQRARLLEIADRCPVHRTLHSEVSIVSALVEDRAG